MKIAGLFVFFERINVIADGLPDAEFIANVLELADLFEAQGKKHFFAPRIRACDVGDGGIAAGILFELVKKGEAPTDAKILADELEALAEENN